MRDQKQLRLFMVVNPVPFERYEDHRAALEILLHELVELALWQKEDAVALIEEYLKVDYNSGHYVDDIAAFLINTPQMVQAFQLLSDNWDQLDNTIPEESTLKYGGISRQEAMRLYSELNLRNYLEALSTIYHD